MHAYQECDWETRLLDKSSFKMGGVIEIIPLSGRKKQFKLSRTSMKFISENLGISASSTVKALPSLKKDTFHLNLELKSQLNTKGHQKDRFILESINGRPFWHNGSLVFSILLREGDEVEIGHNKIRFLPPEIDEQKESFLDHYQRLIESNIPILIQGETGTGKTSLARQIHERSERSGHFVHLNLSALSDNLLESELFGHIKGAFTGAINDKKGAITKAHRGTLFLDEVDSISKATQVKLLLFLDNYKVTPVGGSVSSKIDCRLILASGSELRDLVGQGVMRKDFFYRVSSGQNFKLGSLSEEPEKILKFCHDFERTHFVVIEERLKEYYQKIQWPGNFRQLKGHLERKLLFAKGSRIIFDQSDEYLLMKSTKLNEKIEQTGVRPLNEVRDNYCIRAYFSCHKNMALTAKQLAIAPNSLRSVLRRKKIR